MKRKIYLELGITLIVGFLIGFFVNSIVTDKRIKDFSMHKGDSSFWRRALIEVQATETQKKEIMPIIKAYSEETREILHESWELIPPVWDKMEGEIMEHLSPEQQIQIKALQEARKQNMQKNINRNSPRERGGGQEFRGERREGQHQGQKRPPSEMRKKNKEQQAPSPTSQEVIN